jgi:PAS domain S-box-containing protein
MSPLKRLVEKVEPTNLLRLLEGQSRLLEKIAQSAPLATVLEELTRVLEEQVEPMVCSVLLLSDDGKRLRHGAAPSLPETYWRALDGAAIGPRAGSCGTAAFLGQQVIVTDIARDPLWADYDYRDLALEVGLKACWSTPIVSGRHQVLGTLGMYHPEPVAPSPMHFGLIDVATTLARIAIERDMVVRDRERLSDAKRFADWYRMVLRATRDLVWEWNLESGAIHWDKDGLATFGYENKKEKRTSNWWTEHIHQSDVERVSHGIELAIDSGKPIWEEEYRFRRKNGTYADVFARALIVRDDAGKAVRLVGSMQDVTRRKRHELEVEQLAERLQLATIAAAVGTWHLDVKTEFFIADASLNRLIGRKEEETIQRFSEVMRIVHPEDRTRVAQTFDASIQTGRPYESDYRVVLPDGEIRWFRSRGRALFDKQGVVEALTGAAADITELKRNEQSMATLADASRLLGESLDFDQTVSAIAHMAVPAFADAVLIRLTDRHTGEPQLVFAHAANPELLATLREMQRTDSFPPAAPSRRVVQTGRGELHPKLTEEWILTQDLGENGAALIRRFRVSSLIHVPIKSSGQPCGVMVFATTGTRVFDTTDLAFAEELAHRASNAMHNVQLFQTAKIERARAEEAVALRERLVAIVGHDLRNPLQAIIVAAHVLSRSELAAREEGLVKRIHASANRMMRMIAQLLDFTRIRAGMSFELQFRSANLHEICTAVVDELRTSRPDRHIDLDIEGNGDTVCDTDRIAQLLSNLVGNAIQHGTQRPISVTVRNAEPDAVSVAIHNFGPPIPDDAQTTIFDAFRQAPTTGEDSSKSIGLGLFIANEIARAHGGSIAVRSPDRDGTTFTVVIPRRPASVVGSDAEFLPGAAS